MLFWNYKKGGREESSRKQLSSTELWQMWSSQTRADSALPSRILAALGQPGAGTGAPGWGRSSLQGSQHCQGHI